MGTLLLASPTGTTWPLRWTVQPSKSSGGGPMGSQGASMQGTSTTRCGECRWTQGNYLLLGGSGDEYSYSAESNGQVSDIWVSYLVVVSKNGDKLFEGTYGNPGGNEAGEYLTVTSTGDIMIYTDSDTTPGFGFLKIT